MLKKYRLMQVLFIAPLFFTCHAEAVEQTAQTTLYPSSLTTTVGSNSDQPISALAIQDQTGKQNNWNNYKEFYTASNGYVGKFVFELPSDVPVSGITALSLATNYRGDPRSQQRWRWQIRDFSDSKWVLLTDNKNATNWKWSAITAAASGDLTRFVNAKHQLQLRYATSSDADDSELDYLALDLSYQSSSSPTPSPSPSPTPAPSGVWHPKPGTSWQWQLQGTIDTSQNVQMYDIDLFDAQQSVIDQLHAQGKKVICYFSAGSWEDWRPDAAQYPDQVKGKNNGWAGEKWVDIRRLDLLGPILDARLDLAVSKGCDGVEPDNVDGYTNKTGFPLTYQDQITFNTWLAQEAHARNLSVGLKNDLDQIMDLLPHFDWALDEQCFQYNECSLLVPFIQAGKAVFGVEYEGDPSQFCPEANSMQFDWLKKNLDLDAWRVDCRSY
jgi:hypothetical protein